MGKNIEFLKTVYDKLPVAVMALKRDGSLIWGNKALFDEFPSLERESSVFSFLPKEAMENILSSQNTFQSYVPGTGLSVTVIPDGDDIFLEFVKNKENAKESLMSSLLLPVPHIFRSSISEMLMSVSSIYAIGEEKEDERIMELSKKLNLSCYKILRGNNLVTSYCRELAEKGPEKEYINLADMVKTVGEAAGFIANDVGIAFDISIEEKMIPVKVQEDSLTEALLAVFDNACKFSSKGNKVRIKLKRSGKNAVITVSDEGIGIPGDVMEHIFEPYYSFWRDEEPLSGVGLGLTLARLVFIKHGGNIQVSSKDYEGTTVIMTLPVENMEKDISFNSKVTLTTLLRNRFSPLHVMFSDNNTVPLP